MTARLSSFFIWAVVAATVAAWGLRLGTRGSAVPSHAATAMGQAPVTADLSRLFGLPPAPAQAVAEVAPVPQFDARFKLIGVVAPQKGVHAGLALLSVDGKAPRAYGVGSEIEPGLRVQRVDHRHAELQPAGGAPAVTLELPVLPEPNRGRPGDAPAAVAAPALPGLPGLVRQPQGMAPIVGMQAPGNFGMQARPQANQVMVPPPVPEQIEGANGNDAPTIAVPQQLR